MRFSILQSFMFVERTRKTDSPRINYIFGELGAFGIFRSLSLVDLSLSHWMLSCDAARCAFDIKPLQHSLAATTCDRIKKNFIYTIC